MAVEPKTIENFLDAMNIIATHRATESQVGDKTILCTITDDSKAEKESRYTVTDGSARFNVFDNLNEAGKKKYKTGDQVYVTIPQNDYNKQKLIQGPYMSDSDLLPVTYVSPLDSFVDMATLTKNDKDVSGSLKSNGEKTEVLLWSMNCKDSTYSDLQKNNVYDTIGLQASFKCLLDDFNMRAGSYGLRMDLAIRLTPTSSRTVRKSIYLDSTQFFGNPYAFTVFSPQTQTYDISSLGIVDGIAISLYQNDDFQYFDGKDVQRINPKSVEDNIFVTDVYIALGSEISKVTDNTVKLYTDDELTFSYNTPSDTNNSKTLGILWYNKTEENQYIGFSDGRVDVDKDGNIIHYDELDYLELANAEERLLNQKSNNVPSDENGLTVAANWQDANDVLTKITNFLKGDLSSHLTQFEKRVNGVMVGKKDMATYFRGDSGKAKKIEDIYNSVVGWHEDLKEYFPKALKAAAAIQKHQQENTTPEEKVEITSKNIYSEQKLKNVFKDIKEILGVDFNDTEEVIGWIFEDLKDSIKNTYPSFQNGYDVFSNKLKQDIKSLKAMFDKLNENLDGLEARITSTTEASGSSFKYNFGTTIIDYEEKDLSGYDNRYCIYWYRYDSKETDEDGIMGNGWVRIKPGTQVQTSELETNLSYTMPNNLGLPSKYNLVEQVNKFEKKPEQDEGLLQVYLNPNRKKEKFKVAVFYNHEMFESNELEFENADDVLDLSYINVSDEIEIRNGNNSHDSYQTMYAASNKLSNTAEALTQRQITIHYNGLMGDDELLSGAQVFWYIPRNATMLNVDVNKLTDENGLNFTTDYYRTARVLTACTSYRGPSTNYDDVHNYSAGDEITAIYDKVDGYYSLKSTNAKGINGEWIQEDNLQIIDDKEIYRDGFACFYKTIGFDEVPLTEINEDGEEVEVKDEDGNTVLTKSVKAEDQIFQYQIREDYVSTALNNTIFCVVKYGDNEYSFETAKTFLFGQQGTTGTNYTISITPAGAQTAVKSGDPLELLVKAFDFNNVEMDINTGEIDVSKPSSEPYICNPQFNWLGNFTGFKANSTTNSDTAINDFTIGYQDDSNPVHYGILNFNVDLYNSSHGGTIQLTNYYPVPSSEDADKNYYIEGPTNIVYDSSGTNPSYYKNPYKIFDGSNGNELDACIWSIKYFLPDGKYFTIETGDKDEDGNTPRTINGTASGEEVNFYAPYVPILNPDNTITASQIYISDETQGQNGLPFYPVVTCTRGGVNIWHQPLVIYQNRYPNSMINNWDGNFKIDEDNGTILSQMVGAGIKNNDNTFSGILMGNVGGKTNADNADGLGIYGYHHGAQSLNLSVDGTAFFGKSDRGRIYFDGNSGTISSASYQQSRQFDEDGNLIGNDSGMMIDLDDGFIDMVGTTEFTGEDWENYPEESRRGHTEYSTGDEENPGYKEEYGALYKSDGTHSHLRLDVNSPYFQITSQNGNRLLHIGSDDKNFPLFTSGTYDDYVQTIKDFEDEDGGKGKGYYIKSDNYAPTLFSLDDKEPNENGAGMLIDLNSGRIDAYDLKLFSKNLFIDSGAEETFFMLKDNDGCILMRAGDDDLLIKSHSYTKWINPSDDAEAAKNNSPGIRLAFGTNTSKPYVNIQGKESSIFYVGESSYYIQTDGYSNQGKTGANINLSKGDFNLIGYNSSGDYAGSYVKLSSSAPYFRVHLKDSDSDLDLIYIGNETFYMKSPNWVSNQSGMLINMMTPKIEMYNKDNSDKGLWINADKTVYPIQIGDAFENTSGNIIRNLRFSWDGGIYGGHHSAKNKGDDYYPWYITPKGVISFNSGDIDSCNINNCTMTKAKIKTGSIGGWTIGTNLSGNGTISGGTISGSTISGSTISGGTISGTTVYIDDHKLYFSEMNYISNISTPSSSYEYGWGTIGSYTTGVSLMGGDGKTVYNDCVLLYSVGQRSYSKSHRYVISYTLAA